MCLKCLWYEPYYGFMFAFHIFSFALITVVTIHDIEPLGFIIGLFVAGSMFMQLCPNSPLGDLDGRDYFKYELDRLKSNRRDEPGKFCAIFSGVMLSLAIIGQYVSGMTALVSLITTGLLLHGHHVFMNMSCRIDEYRWSQAFQDVQRNRRNEYADFLPYPSTLSTILPFTETLEFFVPTDVKSDVIVNNNNNNNNNIDNNNKNDNDNPFNYDYDNDTNENISDDEIPQDLLLTDSLPGFNDISSDSSNDEDEDAHINDHNNIPGGINEYSSSDDDSIIKSLRFNDDMDGNIFVKKSKNVPKSNTNTTTTTNNHNHNQTNINNNNNNNNSHSQNKMNEGDKLDVYNLEECPSASSTSSNHHPHLREQPEILVADTKAYVESKELQASEQLRKIISNSICAAVIKKANEQTISLSSSSSSDDDEFEFITTDELNQFTQ